VIFCTDTKASINFRAEAKSVAVRLCFRRQETCYWVNWFQNFLLLRHSWRTALPLTILHQIPRSLESEN